MSEYKLANGHDNEAGLEELQNLSAGLFGYYVGGLKTEWHDFVTQILVGSRRSYAPIGLPWCDWVMFKITPQELKYLKDNFGPEVTVRTFDKGRNAFYNFNAIILFPDTSAFDFDIGEWIDLKISFIDLVEVI